MDIDAAGVAVTGGLIGAAVEKPAGEAGEAHHLCSDCGAKTHGRFCQECGQPTHVHRTLLHLFEEILHGVMHFDSRVWRTLPLLFLNPGKLTREWVMGRRTRYVSPLAMFLFTVFVMFMLLSFMPVTPETEATPAERQAASGTMLFRAANAVTQAEVALENAPKGEDPESAARRRELEADVRAARKELEQANAAMQANPTAPDMRLVTSGWAQELREAAISGQLKVNTGNPDLDKKLKKKLENPELALYKIQQTFYKFSFLLIPISIPFVAILFLWKRGFTLYDHGVFVLYSLTFVALLMMASAIASRASDLTFGLLLTAIPFIVPIHMFAQVKGAYSLSVFSALWRTALLLMFSSIALSFFVTAIIMLGLTG
jgi:hypothetical protein